VEPIKSWVGNQLTERVKLRAFFEKDTVLFAGSAASNRPSRKGLFCLHWLLNRLLRQQKEKKMITQIANLVCSDPVLQVITRTQVSRILQENDIISAYYVLCHAYNIVEESFGELNSKALELRWLLKEFDKQIKEGWYEG